MMASQCGLPRNPRRSVPIIREAMLGEIDWREGEESFEAEEAFWNICSKNEILFNRIAAQKEMESMTEPQSEHTSKFVSEEIQEVMAEEAGRFSACTESRQRGIRTTIGHVPAEYADRLTHMRFVRSRDTLRALAEDEA
jgi:hypothetical protein